MRNTITLNGISSDTITGLLIQELPAISKPLMRTTIEEIDGRDGDIVTELGYSAYDKEITIGLYGSFDINAVIAYFATEGTVVFSNEPDKFYRYKIIDQIDYERLVRYRTATVKLHCQPFKYPTSETPVQLGSGQTVTAEGTDLTMQGTALAPFVDVRPKGNTEQTTYTGKNLLLATSTGSPVYGILATNNSDGTVTLSGTGTENAVAPFSDTTLDLPAGTYTLSLTESLPVRTLLRDVVASYNTWVIEPGGTSVTATTTATTKIRLWFYLANGVAIDKTVGFQLESGETASAFEPYVGGTAAPNPEYPQDVKVVTGEQTVKVNGKNLNVYPYTGGGSARGITFTANSDGTVTLNGHNDGRGNSVYFFLNNKTRVLPAGTYFMIPPSNTRVTYVMYDGTNYYSFAPTNGYSRTFDTDTSIMQFYVQTYDDTITFSDFKVYPMLTTQANPTEADYEPYKSQEYKLNLGKNLFNKSDLHIYKGYISGAGVLSQVDPDLTSGNDRFIYMECEPNTTYTVTKPLQHTTANNRFALGTQSVLNISSNQHLSDSWSGGDGTTTTTHTFTTSSDAHYLIIFIGKATDRTNPGGEIQDILDGLQVEKGSTATEYAPYFEPIELCKIGDYQDYIYKNGNDWYKHEAIKKATLPTSGYSRWTTQPTACMFYKNGVLSDALFQKGAITAVIENLPVMPQVGNMTEYYNTYAQVNEYGFVLKTDTPGIMVQNKNYSTVADFHTWIAANPVVVRYVLATPVDTKITNEALIEQLNTLGNANSYRDTTYIKTASNGTDLPVILAVTATGKADGTVTNAGNTYAKPKLTIYGTGNIGIYLNGSQMFQIELGSEGHITIDTEKMEAYKDSESNLKNRLVTGDYSKFRLEAGENRIDFSGNINKCVVENYTRWL